MSIKACNTGTSIVSTAYVILKTQKGYKSLADLKHDSDIKYMLSGAIDEIAEANKMLGIEMQSCSIDSIIDEACKENDPDRMAVESLLSDCAKQSRLLGLLPYHICRILAYAVDYKAQNDESLGLLLKNEGLFAAIKHFCGIDRQVQIITQIADAFEQNKAGITKSGEYISLVKKAYKKGFYYEQKYGGCAQCCIAACCETLGIDFDDIFKAATVLSGGCAVCTDGSCGSYSGAAIIIGMHVGRSFDGMLNGSDDESYGKANELGQKLHKKYIDTYGGVTCKDVQKSVFGRSYLLSDEEEVIKFRQAGAHEDRCPSVVAAASAWTVGILYDEGLL